MLDLPYELVTPPVELGTTELAPASVRGVVDAEDPARGPVLVATGGGRVMVAAAERSAREGRQWLAVPTTYAPACLLVRPGPARVLADPALPAALPPGLLRTSVAAARAVAVEALWAPDATPSVHYVALSALRTLHRALAAPDAADRAAVQRAALLAAVGAANTAPGLVGMLARALEPYGVAWAPAMAVLLPRVAAWQGRAAVDALATVADVAGAGSWESAPDALRLDADALVVPPDAVSSVAEALTGPAAPSMLSPRLPDRDDLRLLLLG